MRCRIYKFFFIFMIGLLFCTSNVYSFSTDATGVSHIKNRNIKLAKKDAINNALLSAIKQYYYSIAPVEKIQVPEITNNYLKYVKKFIVLSDRIDEGNKRYSINLQVTVDTIGLRDASEYTSQQTNSAVFSIEGIDYMLIGREVSEQIITDQLRIKNFILLDQDYFEYSTRDDSNIKKILKKFNNHNANFYFNLSADLIFDDFTNQDSKCELILTTSVYNKVSEKTVLRINTDSKLTNTVSCVEDVLTKGMSKTLDYIRSNVVRLDTLENVSHKLNIIMLNFNNMVTVNNLLNSLKDRKYISDFNIKSFAQKEVMIEVTAFINEADMVKRLSLLLTDNTNVYVDDNEIIVNFNNN